jgi:uncharacterized membrane protein
MSEREAKREQFNDKPAATKKLLVPVIVLIVACAAAGAWFLSGQSAVTGPELVAADRDGKIRFSAADFNDGKARFYRLDGQAGPIDFFVVRSVDGVIRSAFDTCDVCYKERKGYRQDGNDMVCNNCGQRFRTDMINVVKGGCNPAPLRRQLVGETLVISTGDIEQGAWYFSAVN